MNAPLPPSAVPPIWTTGATTVFKTGTWRASLPLHVHAPSPCHQACPVHGEIADWIGRARDGDWRAAFDILVRHNPFPAIAGRVCHHPCESSCNRVGYDSAVSICALERFAGDRAIAEACALPAPEVERSGHVAIVGAGPAGLSAAYQLRRRGWRVTVYESTAEAGGLMRHGIPAYRLAREVLDAEIARIVALGVELRLNTPLAGPEALAALSASHDAVFVAVGAAKVKRLPGLDYAWPGVVDGAAYLAAANAGSAPALGHVVVVIGGGSAAFDAARSARRAGHAVTVAALESRAQLPAQPEEVDEALEEGITLVDGAMLASAVQRDGRIALRLQKVRFERGAVAGRFSVTPLDGPALALDADAIITSIGQDPDLALVAGQLSTQGNLITADGWGATSAAKVWAGGDAVSMSRHVTEAVHMGERAALAIHARLLGEPQAEAAAGAATTLEQIATFYHPKAPRADGGRRAADERVRDQAEVQLALDAGQAAAESARCFSCGSCVTCDNCVVVCPDMAVERAPQGGYLVLGDYCKGCGLCVRECPTGSMRMQEQAR